MTSFTNPSVEYFTTSTSCSCPHFQYRHPEGGCKHIRALVGAKPRNINEARAARIQRNRETAAAYIRMQYNTYDIY